MNDKDFDDIGRRLHDWEVDPPKDGWKKVGGALLTQQPGKQMWVRKNWWKPLTILIPAAIYITYSAFVNQAEPMAAITVAASSKKATKEQSASESTEQVENLLTENGRKSDSLVVESTEKPESSARKRTKTDGGSLTTTGHKRTSNNKLNKEVVLNGKTTQSTELMVADQANLISNDEHVWKGVSKSKIEKGGQIDSVSDQVKTHAPIITSAEEKAEEPFLLKADSGAADSLATMTSPVESVTVPTHVSRADTATVSDNDDQKRERPTWRATVSLVPSYQMKTVNPNTTDEVLLTKVDHSKSTYRSSLGFGAGIGRAIGANLYWNAQLSYSQVQQDIFFSYATGIVDTLIAVQRADESVMVSPVYEEATREIKSRYQYGGLRIGGTYYFWTKARTRFNITAMAGIHYLLKSTVEEKLTDRWVALSNENLNKTNYTLMVGGGYNINLNRGWELLLNPSLTYYLREVKSRELPYSINQRSVGLLVMVSKKL